MSKLVKETQAYSDWDEMARKTRLSVLEKEISHMTEPQKAIYRLVEYPDVEKSTYEEEDIISPDQYYTRDGYFYYQQQIARQDSVSNFRFVYDNLYNLYSEIESVGMKINSDILYETDQINGFDFELPLISCNHEDFYLFVKTKTLLKGQVNIKYQCHMFQEELRRNIMRNVKDIYIHCPDDKLIMVIEKKENSKRFGETDEEKKFYVRMDSESSSDKYITLSGIYISPSPEQKETYSTNFKDFDCNKHQLTKRLDYGNSLLKNIVFSYQNEIVPKEIQVVIGGMLVYSSDNIYSLGFDIPKFRLEYHAVHFVFKYDSKDIPISIEEIKKWQQKSYINIHFDVSAEVQNTEPFIIHLDNYPTNIKIAAGMAIACDKNTVIPK